MKKLLYLLPLVAFTSLVACNKDGPKQVTREKFDEKIAGVVDKSNYTYVHALVDEVAKGQAFNTSSQTVVPADKEHHRDREYNKVDGEWQMEQLDDLYIVAYFVEGTINNYATVVSPDLDYCTFHLNPFMVKCVWDEDDVEGGAPYHVHQTWKYVWDGYGRLKSMRQYTEKTWNLTGIVEGYTTITATSESAIKFTYR